MNSSHSIAPLLYFYLLTVHLIFLRCDITISIYNWSTRFLERDVSHKISTECIDAMLTRNLRFLPIQQYDSKIGIYWYFARKYNKQCNWFFFFAEAPNNFQFFTATMHGNNMHYICICLEKNIDTKNLHFWSSGVSFSMALYSYYYCYFILNNKNIVLFGIRMRETREEGTKINIVSTHIMRYWI